MGFQGMRAPRHKGSTKALGGWGPQKYGLRTLEKAAELLGEGQMGPGSKSDTGSEVMQDDVQVQWKRQW